MKHRLTHIALATAAAFCLALPAVAQEKPAPPAPTGPAASDPFYRKPKPVKVAEPKDANKPVLVPFPPLQQRQQDFQRSRQAARAKGQPEPDPIGQYLVDELIVTGVFETDTGTGAFILARPTNTTFFVGAGTRVYNGEIVSVNTGTNFDLGQVVFRKMTRYRLRKQEQNVIDTVTKPVEAPTKK
jgi:hypothetical protein